MPNALLPLIILTWLRQLQEYFFEINDSKEAADWNKYGKYCAVRASQVDKDFPLDSMHMMKANSSGNVKVESFEYIKPDQANNKLVIKSLEEWASNILYRDSNDYAINIAKADEEIKKRFKRTESRRTKYAMTDTSYKPNEGPTINSGEIKSFKAADHQ